MLRQKILLWTLACTLSLTPLALRAGDSGIGYPAKIAGKLAIGMINATTGLVEIPKSIMTTTAEDGIGMGMSLGLAKGFSNMLGRSLLGMVDVVSFPIPTKPMVSPPVVFQEFDQETSYSNGWETY